MATEDIHLIPGYPQSRAIATDSIATLVKKSTSNGEILFTFNGQTFRATKVGDSAFVPAKSTLQLETKFPADATVRVESKDAC